MEKKITITLTNLLDIKNIVSVEQMIERFLQEKGVPAKVSSNNPFRGDEK